MEIAPDTITRYARRSLAAMATTLGRFDDTTVNARPFGESTNSAAILVTHTCGAATFWLEHVGLGMPTQRDRDSEFNATATVQELRELLEATGTRLEELVATLDSREVTHDHELRGLLCDGDTTDGSLVVHILEEIFQHLGHLEITADALAPTPTA